MIRKIFLVLLVLTPSYILGQKTDANIFGDVKSGGEHLPFVTISVKGRNIGTTTDRTGHYMLINIPEGKHTLVARMIGYKTVTKEIEIKKSETIEVNFVMEEEVMGLNEVVVTGTKTFQRRTESPVIVNIIDSKTLNSIQATSLSEGLCFQPGLRVETDCQTCNYSQLRMNGLGGGYSQILINSRPVFSPLTGLYGLEQIPANMIERIEVVRGGGSALYGSSAIGGTVNVLTRIPEENHFDVSINNSIINNESTDRNLTGNASVLSRNRLAGITLFVANRDREEYDHNDDGFSELPQLRNNSFGLNSFFKPAYNQKLELNFSSLNEFRRGGDSFSKPAYLAEQSEERTHDVLMGGLDYEINFNNNKTNLITYTGAQKTDRKHYTGVIPDKITETTEYNAHINNPPYGESENKTFQIGSQINHKFNMMGGTNLFTFGAEYVYDDILDVIEAYNYKLDQTTENLGIFLQSDWKLTKNFTLLTGVRSDKHNMVDNMVFNPRVTLLYKYLNMFQFRTAWSTGFRAPQAFDADTHIAFAGGGISKVVLSDDLKEETSNSFTASVNFDKATESYIWGFTLEGFYTKLNDAFILEDAGTDQFGSLFMKKNGDGSTVSGSTIELRGNYNKMIQVETGFTFQKSEYDKAVNYSNDLKDLKEYLRTPDNYGYYTLTITPVKSLKAAINGTYTGNMKILHVAGVPETGDKDVYVDSDPFMETNIKLSYSVDINKIDSKVEFFGGIQNIFDAYQDDFDTGKNRDSNYIYGPARPRTVFFGVKVSSL